MSYRLRLYTLKNEKSTANFRKLYDYLTFFFHFVNLFTIMLRILRQNRCIGIPVQRFMHGFAAEKLPLSCDVFFQCFVSS